MLELQSSIRPEIRKIPAFWPYAFSNLDLFGSIATMMPDLDALSSLEDVELIVDWRDPRAYSLVFHFGENKYFHNKTLTRSYVLVEGSQANQVAKAAEEGATDDGKVSDEQIAFQHEADLKALVGTCLAVGYIKSCWLTLRTLSPFLPSSLCVPARASLITLAALQDRLEGTRLGQDQPMQGASAPYGRDW